MGDPLTSKQKKILDAIQEFYRLHNRMPTHAELAKSLGYKSVNSIQQYLKTLKDKGYLDVDRHKSRGMKLLEINSELVNIPLIGQVACGLPILAEENIEAYIPVERQLVGNDSQRFFFLTAQGDSMNLAGIEDGDLLLIQSKQEADPNSIVVALIGDDATVKFFKPSSDYVALVPKSTNSQHKPIIVTENFAIQGIVKKVLKKEDLII